jgi:hypothetical protein
VEYVMLPSKSLNTQRYNALGAYKYKPGKTHKVTFVNPPSTSSSANGPNTIYDC